jgi:hypothetical protein
MKDQVCEHGLTNYFEDDGVTPFNNGKGRVCQCCFPELVAEAHPDKPKSSIKDFGKATRAQENGMLCDQFTIDQLKAGCIITFNVPPQALDTLQDDYYSIKHEALGLGTHVFINNGNKRWYSSMVEFKLVDGMTFYGVNVHKSSHNRSCHCVNTNEFIGFLLDQGLKVGRNDG